MRIFLVLIACVAAFAQQGPDKGYTDKIREYTELENASPRVKILKDIECRTQ